MRKLILSAAGAALICAPAIMVAQSKGGATYITKEEVDLVNKQPGTDRTIRVLDIGHENFAVGVIHRGATGAARGAAGGGGGAAGGGGARAGAGGGAGAAGGGGRGAGGGAAAAAEPCGEKAASPPPAGTPNGLYHESQTEGYYIISGAGTMVTGGHIVNGRKSAADAQVTTELNGPSCSGSIMGSDVVLKDVKVGDIIIIPAGVPHGWTTIPDHVDYLSFRPSQRVLTAGYVHPSLKK
jgi:mannose-6-phosphate isomerase-like protein (cupin superfamily)